MIPASHHFKNRILGALPKAELGRLTPHLSAVTLKIRQTLSAEKIPYAYFLEDGIASVVVTLREGNTVEVGVIGIDGVVGIANLLGGGTMPGRQFIQIAGSGFRMQARLLKDEFERQGKLRQHIQKYMQGFLTQSAQSAACNRLHNIEERLSRWLLTCRDRMESDRLALTQEFLGQMVGAPRTTVTLAAGILQRAGLIRYSRGVVVIQNRSGLQDTACECYQIVRDEYRRLGLL